MVQLSLLASEAGISLPVWLDVLAREARRRGVADNHVRDAVQASAFRFNAWDGRELAGDRQARVRAYFEAVIRRRVLSRRDAVSVSARRRLVAASIEADLVGAGWSRVRAREEALRVLGVGDDSAGAA
ncbi:MAG: hypothetical protein JXP72_00535 [Coriobacteriia bacterium]|nr:hypothetical protein [Coriobacteriia bacterium]